MSRIGGSSSNVTDDLPPIYSETDASASGLEISNFDEYFEMEETSSGSPQPSGLTGKGKGKKKEKKPQVCPICGGSHKKRKCPANNQVKMCRKCERSHSGKCPIVVVQQAHTVIDLQDDTTVRQNTSKFNCLQIVALMTFIPIVLGLILFGLYEVFSKPLKFTPAAQMADVAIIAQFSKVAFVSQFSYFSIVSQISICSVFSMFSVCSFASLFSLFSFYGVFSCVAVYFSWFTFWIVKKG